MGNCLHLAREKSDLGDLAFDPILQPPNLPLNIQPNEDEALRVLNQQLFLLKEKYEKSQEIIHDLKNSRREEVIKVCEKPTVDSMATQTDQQEIPDNDESDLSGSIEKLSLEESRFPLTTLVEEEGESEGSWRGLNGDKRRAGRTEEPAVHNSDDECKSEYLSPMGSLPVSSYNSLERPLQFSSNSYKSLSLKDGADSEGNTTWGSPISSPSSPTYWTMSGESSSQETITNLDGGDQTPVNEYFERGVSCPPQTYAFEYPSPNGSVRKRLSILGPLATLNPGKTHSTGNIHEQERDLLLTFAQDCVIPGTVEDSQILTSKEWQEVKKELEAQRFAQNKKDGVQPPKSIDLDDEAEIYCDNFPDLVDRLFQHMDTWSEKPSAEQLEKFSKRFEHLSTVFKTNHSSLPARTAANDKELLCMQMKFKAISDKFNSSFAKLDKYMEENLDQIPDEILKEILSLKEANAEFDSNLTPLIKSSKKKGMLDNETRIYKMIEVMVFYLHILRNLYNNADKDFLRAKSILDDHGLLEVFTNNQPFGKLMNNNKTAWNGGYLGHQDNLERFEGDGKKNDFLHHLVPRWPSINKILGMRSKEQSRISKCFSEGCEFILHEFHWSWNWEETWRGLKQGFAIICILIGLVLVTEGLFFSTGVDVECRDVDLDTYLLQTFNLQHKNRPRI